MTYSQAVEYILSIPKFTKKNDISSTQTFLEYLGSPQERLKVLHVAGTNGKGSVCAYLDSMLRSEGKRTGLFTSPHLVRINERIAIDGESINDGEFIAVFKKTRKAALRMRSVGMGHPTFFEFLLGMALCAFESSGMEYAVIETGLGGRKDATRAISHPVVCAITSIGLDHTEYLGDSLEKIAWEKAGIIRQGVPIFFSGTADETDSVIESVAQQQGSFCKKIGKDAYEILGIEDKHIAFSCTSAYYGTTTWKLNNTGIYQPHNAMLAMEVMRYLFGKDGHPQRWRDVLGTLKWAGRMEEVLPDVYIDGAHNVSAAEAFVHSILGERREKILLFSAARDKNYREMIRCLCSIPDIKRIVVTRIGTDRGEDARILAEIFKEYTDRPVTQIASEKEAVRFVLRHQEGCPVYCLGSLYLIGDIKKLLQEVI